jgi:LmbE family N-acetylglucosaminyl deacetylase
MTPTQPLRVMSIMAHQDDFEFNAGGAFALLRQTHGSQVQLKVVATSRGASGHHEMTPDQTFVRRQEEATAAAALVGAGYECLTCLDGSHVQAQVLVDRNLLGGLWNVIRDFEPDVIFCPPVTRDPLAGIHVDHESTAMAVRMVAYQLVAPHAYPTMRGPVKPRVPRPIILNVDDPYAAEGQFHIRQDIRDVFELKQRMGLCHRSQVFEWLPWSAGREAPSEAQWRESFHARHLQINRRYGQPDDTVSEFFRVTRWGRAPQPGELQRIFPRIMPQSPALSIGA